MINLLIILFLIFLGTVLLLIEFVIIPGVTIAGIGGGLLLMASIYIAFDSYGVLAGILTLLFVIIAVPVLVYRFLKGRMGKKVTLESEITGRVPEVDTDIIKVGDEGITVGRLAPIGKVRVKDQVLEGKSNGSFIDHDTKIRVTQILKTQLIVETIN